MKHPHCNRSFASHLFWCRGFAPLVSILAVALIVVAIGVGIYFSFRGSDQMPVSQDAFPATEIVETATSSVTASEPAAVAPSAKPTAPQRIIDCGSESKAASQCIATRITTCSPARGTVVDSDSGLMVERTIDGYKNGACSYRTTIISGKGDFALLAGMEINCLIPAAVLGATVADGSMSQADMFSYCTGSFMDLMRAQAGQ